MRSDLKKLLKKKNRTGADVGRLFIANLVQAYKNDMLGLGNQGLLTEDEKLSLVNGLVEPAHMRQYNDYKAVYDYICQLPSSYMAYEKESDAEFWKLYHILEKTRVAEMDAWAKRDEPRIVTQAQYDALKKADFEYKMARTLSVEILFFDAVNFFIGQYEDGEKTPFNKFFEETKEKQITNPRIKAYPRFSESASPGYYQMRPMWERRNVAIGEDAVEMATRRRAASKNAFTAGQEATVEQVLDAIRERKKHEEQIAQKLEWVDAPRSPLSSTLYDVLAFLVFYYCSEETGSNQTFFEIEQDFPDLYKAVMDHLVNTAGLAFIKDIARKEYVAGGAHIPMKILYDNNVLDYKKDTDTFNPALHLDGFDGGIAILQESGHSYPHYRINKNGHYKDPEDTSFARHRAEVLIDKYGENIRDWLDKIKSGYRDMYAFHAFLAITGELIGVPGLDTFISPIDETKIETLNALFEEFGDFLYGPREGENSRPFELLNEEIKAVLKPINLSSLQPTEEQVKRARAAINFDTFKGGARDFIESLARGEEGDT